MAVIDCAVVDAFTDSPFAGNPAGVCLLDAPADEAWMQALAGELGHSETAFAHPEGEHWALRWFSPVEEVDLCGHATLATAHRLAETGRWDDASPLEFSTASGTLLVRRHGSGLSVEMPSRPATEGSQEFAPPGGWSLALGAEVAWLGAAEGLVLVEIADPDDVVALTPDLAALATLPARGVCVTAAGGGPGVDVTSRCFYPAIGINEDPVTGAAHCTIAPHWAARLGTNRLVCEQASARGGRLVATVAGDRVEVEGRAVTVLAGTLAPSASPPER